MSDEQDKLKVSLEPPRLFGRKKKAAGGTPKPASRSQTPEPEAGSETAAEPVEPVVEAEPDVAVEPEPEPEPEPAPEPESAPEPEPEPEPTSETVIETEPVAASPARPSAAKQFASRARAQAGTAAKKASAATKKLTEKAPEAPNGEAAPPVPTLTRYPAAAVTGAIVGLVMVALAWLGLRGCEIVRGVSSCTGGPGLLLLIATFVLSLLLGSALLKSFTLRDPTSTSFLAVGVLATLSILFFVDLLDHWSILLILPVLGACTYAGSVWLTETLVESDERG